MIQSSADTIAAVATPIGEGGIAVIRISGPRAIEVADVRFVGRKRLMDVSSHSAHFGYFKNRHNEEIDEVVATVFRAPNSYTAEDVVELSCHGGVYVTNAILSELIASGARLAMPGEFTKRAFLNGRMDLSQAEAVADLIQSRSERFHKVSLQHLRGDISKEITNLREKILSISSRLELELDFSEEGLKFLGPKEVLDEIDCILSLLQNLLASFQLGRVYKEGLKVVLAGRPNVGKSSILNRLLKYERAIVTEIPGTTRDTIEESISIDGLLFRLVDTAGVRAADNPIEEKGILRATEEMRSADIVLFVIEANSGFLDSDLCALQKCKTAASHNKILIIANKSDLASPEQMRGLSSNYDGFPVHIISAKSGDGITEVVGKLIEVATSGVEFSSESSLVITSERHRAALMNALSSMKNARNATIDRKSNEFVAAELRFALNELASIIGLITSEDILNNIFSKFCIGK